MSEKALTPSNILASRLDAARARERAARAEASRLRREMAAADRRMETQRLCTLGRAWIAWGERDDRMRSAALRFLSSYISRDTDRAALAGTAWAVPDASAPAPTPEGPSDA
jgi:hypothetical protein